MGRVKWGRWRGEGVSYECRRMKWEGYDEDTRRVNQLELVVTFIWSVMVLM